MSAVKLIVGLGNPGPEYANTRHNAGALFVERLAEHMHCPLTQERKYFGLTGKFSHQGQDIRLLIPTTFMNRSGAAVAALCQFYKLTPGELLVVHDELDIPPGTARYKQGGGHGGHNGLRDIVSALGDKDFNRLRIGIGHPGDSRQVTNYVLGRPGKAELETIGASLNECLATLPLAISGDWARAMSQLHSFSG